jgi:arginine decarboxylase-like protein
VDSLEEFCVLGVLEVLQVAEVGDEVGLLVHFLGSQKIEIDRIRKTLDELGWACQ